jgi:hypothetical protein
MGATVQCGHGGQALPMAIVPRVLVSNQPVATVAAPYAVAGCPFTGPSGPCITGIWIVASTRVKAMGQPVAIQMAPGMCAPTGAPLVAAAAQPRVTAT